MVPLRIWGEAQRTSPVLSGLGMSGVLFSADVGPFVSDCGSLSSGKLEVTMGVGGRIIFCAGRA